VFTFLAPEPFGYLYYVLNFAAGAFAITATRAVEAALGQTEGVGAEGKSAAAMIRALARYGLDSDEIKSALKRGGISPKTVDRMNEVINENVPHYLPKIVKMETDIADIKSQLSGLAGAVQKIRGNDLEEIKEALKKRRTAPKPKKSMRKVRKSKTKRRR
jgi:DNA-binding transcriptional MerR regulator